MSGNGRTKNVLPEPFKDSVMKKYEYHDYDEKAGDWIPAPFGNFHVKRPHATFLVPMVFNKDCDPFPVLEEKQIEEGDYLLITTPKTGTHVTHEIMKMLKSGKAVYNAGNKSEEWIDVCPYDKVCKTVPKPRVLCSHVSPSCLPKSFRRSDTKVVMTLRNLKDTMVSFFHHFIGMKPTNSGTEPGTKEEWSVYFKYLLHSDEVAFGNFFNTFADIWDNYRSDPNVLIVFFEDIKRQPMNVVEKIAKHMGVVHSQQLINEIVAAIDINKMKAGKHASEAEYRKMFGGDFSLYRKGEIGEWKQWFSDAQNAEFHKKFDAWNKQRQIPMVFE